MSVLQDAVNVAGVYVARGSLLRMEAQAGRLDFSDWRRRRARAQGGHRSHFRGRGMEFEEVRYYSAGDDVRAIDWRVTARTGEPHTKLYREERERPVIIAVDQGSQMFFGSRRQFKSVLAAEAAALLAWQAHGQSDRVGGVVFAGAKRSEHRPARSRRSLLRLLHDVEVYNHRLPEANEAEVHGSESLLTLLRRTSRPGSRIFLISDLSRSLNPARDESALRELGRHCELIVIDCYDALEMELPAAGLLPLTDGRRRLSVDSGDASVRAKWQLSAAAGRHALKQCLQRAQAHYVDAPTSSDVSTVAAQAIGMVTRVR